MGIELRGKNGAIDLSRKMMKGDDGGYYIPSIDSEGNLTWAPSETEMPAVEGANIKGQKGDSAYETAVNNGFEGTEKQWLESLEANVESISNIELEKILKL